MLMQVFSHQLIKIGILSRSPSAERFFTIKKRVGDDDDDDDAGAINRHLVNIPIHPGHYFKSIQISFFYE